MGLVPSFGLLHLLSACEIGIGDMLTKALVKPKVEKFRKMMGLVTPMMLRKVQSERLGGCAGLREVHHQGVVLNVY